MNLISLSFDLHNISERANMSPTEDLGQDAICFTAGFTGGPFGAGVTHAHLAADRPKPVVVAGISFGALNAVVMQRCYKELLDEKQQGTDPAHFEAKRWTFFRRYLTALWEQPLDAIWDGLPDQADLFADKQPISDPSTPPHFKKAEEDALHQRYILVKLGRWLARLPLKVSTVTKLIVAYVRYKEDYRGPEAICWIIYRFWQGYILWQLLVHATMSPSFLQGRRGGLRPLFGWPLLLFVWLMTALVAAVSVVSVVMVGVGIINYFLISGEPLQVFPFLEKAWQLIKWVWVAFIVWVLLIWFLPFRILSWRQNSWKYNTSSKTSLSRWLIQKLLAAIGLRDHLVHDFYLCPTVRSFSL
jgi:hypothetical protein